MDMFGAIGRTLIATLPRIVVLRKHFIAFFRCAFKIAFLPNDLSMEKVRYKN